MHWNESVKKRELADYLNLGPLHRHLARHMARRPETLEDDHPVEIPETNVFRQTEHLDRELDDLRARKAQEQEFAEEAFALVHIRVSG